MTSALETIRYHSGIAGEEVADMVDSLEREITELREQVEKLTKERDDLRSRRCEVCGYLEHEREHTGCLREQLAALAEQNAKMRKALTKWRYMDSSYNWRCGHCGNEVEDGHKEGCALSLPNLATPVLNRLKAEAYRELVSVFRNEGRDEVFVDRIEDEADALEKRGTSRSELGSANHTL